MDFEKTILKRHMIRKLKPTPIPDKSVQNIVRLMQHYPSAGFSQGVAFVIVTDAIIRKRLTENVRAYDAPLMIVPCVSEKLYHDRYNEPDKLKLSPDGREIAWPIPYWYFDVGAASMIILLAAVNEGLASAIAGAFRPDLLRKELNIPDHFVPAGIISIGYPDLERGRPSPSLKRGRRPLEQTVHHNKW
jgi:nitroreductase